MKTTLELILISVIFAFEGYSKDADDAYRVFNLNAITI